MIHPVSPDQIAPELRAPLAKMPNLPLHSPLFRRVASVLANLMRTPRVDGVTISRPSGAPALRLYVPDQRKRAGALLWIHGGGYIIGSAKLDDRPCAQVCRELGVPVVSADYRLAPGHPFPAPLDDCAAAWGWLIDQAGTLDVDVERIAIAGISAGGGLAAALVQRLCDGAGPRPTGPKPAAPKPAAQVLFAPMLDDRTAARVELDAAEHPVWNNRLNRIGWAAYLGTRPGVEALPAYAAPARREDLSALPPSWIGVGSIELFHDEDVAYASRLEAAGVETSLTVVPGAPHGFEAWGSNTDIAREHIAKAWNWLAPRL